MNPLTNRSTCPLYPLSAFYNSEAKLPKVSLLEPHQLPHPYQGLLVHERDMTPTLESYFRDQVHLRVLQKWIADKLLYRQVVLESNTGKAPVEFGAIKIYLDRYPVAARAMILDCHCPLGRILQDHALAHTSAPSSFLKVESDATIESALKLDRTYTLFGRRNLLSSSGGTPMAEVVEILPPLTKESARNG